MDTYVITGAFGYSGQYITKRLLASGAQVRTITGHPNRPNPFGEKVAVAPLDFDDPKGLRESLAGARVLFNTYWIRFERGGTTYAGAVENIRKLFEAAADAGVERIVHVSITNPSIDSPLPYFSGKAEVEAMLTGGSVAYSILRPAILFGPEDVLINNIAWLLRRLPVFLVFGDGQHKMQPIFVDDLAELAAAEVEREGNVVMDAVGPEVLTFEELTRAICRVLGRRPLLPHFPPWPSYQMTRLFGWLLGDVVMTRDELRGLMDDLLVGAGEPTGKTRLTEWLAANASTLGATYVSELARHYR